MGQAAMYAAVAMWVGRFGRQAAYLSTFGLLLAMFVVFNFKGDNIRPGTFDFFEDPRWSWLRYVVGGHVVGVALGALAYRGRAPRVPSRPTALVLALALVAMAGNAYRMARFAPRTGWSAFAPTRHWALLTLGLFLLALAALAPEDRHVQV